jgi:hypothetical protein
LACGRERGASSRFSDRPRRAPTSSGSSQPMPSSGGSRAFFFRLAVSSITAACHCRDAPTAVTAADAHDAQNPLVEGAGQGEVSSEGFMR